MSEVQSRPRGGGRAGRGGRVSRGGDRAASKQSAGDSVPLEEQGELGQLKKQYATQLVTLQELFPDWTDEDCVLALQESEGDLQIAIEKISEGAVSQFSDVKKKTREKTKAKPSDTTLAGKDVKDSASGTTRGRGRGGLDAGRGGRGRGAERSRARGARGATSHGPRSSVPAAAPAAASTAAVEEPSWADAPVSGDVPAPEGQWGSVVSSSITPATASEGLKGSLIPEGAKKSWASIAQPKLPPALPKTATPIVIQEEIVQPEPAAAPETTPEAEVHQATPPGLAPPIDSLTTPGQLSEGTMDLSPPKDRLTEDNLEHLPDNSVPPSTETVVSTRDPRSAVGTPRAAPQDATLPPPGIGGFATSAWKAAAGGSRSASFQRRMVDQREAVVMPGNHALNSTALKFGSMDLNGDAKPLDVDEDREEPETRAQPPQQSPSAPRASLPPASYSQQHQTSVDSALPESLPTPKQPAHQQAQTSVLGQSASPQAALGPQLSAQASSQASQPYSQYSRYGGAQSLGQDQQAPMAKPYDPFSQQLPNASMQQEQQGIYGSQSQPQSQNPQQVQSGGSQAPSDFASQYPSDQQRGGYSNYYSSSYGQQAASAQQEHSSIPQRSSSGLGPSDGYGAQGQASSRLGDAQTSGNNTPNPPPMGSQSQQSQHMHQQHGQGSHGGGYGYPYYSNYGSYGSYMNQQPSQYSYNQQGYGGQYGGKGGMYNQPHHGYGMSPQTSFDHSSSPANAGGYGSSMMHGRDSGLSGYGDYGRTGSAQPSQGGQQQSSGAGGFSGMGDSYGRSSASGFQSSSQQYGAQSSGVSDEALKAFADPKSGPSPSLGQPGRPTSGLNTSSGNNQSNYPQQQSQHAGFGGYPSHLQQGIYSSQYSGLGGLGGSHGGGGHQGNAGSHQGGSYGGYGSNFSSSYGNYGRGGWSSNNYGGH